MQADYFNNIVKHYDQGRETEMPKQKTLWARDAELILNENASDEEIEDLMLALEKFKHPALYAIAIYDDGREVEVDDQGGN